MEPKNFLLYEDDLGTWARRVADRDEALAVLRSMWADSEGRCAGRYLDTEVCWVEEIAEWELEAAK